MIRKLTVLLLSGVICLIGVTSALAITYNEAPMLRTKVAAGELPAVEERLPEEPFVVGPGVLLPVEDLDLEIGQYGGTERLVRIWPETSWSMYLEGNEPLVSAPGMTGENIRGNIVQDFEMSDDGKVFVFHMRKGLKWSDGALVTTEDILFTYEDVLLNEKLTPVFPGFLRAAAKGDAEPMKLTVIDEYTFRIEFAEPYGGFPMNLAIGYSWGTYTPLLKPKHYLQKFHPRYTAMEELQPLIKAQALAEGEWWTLFLQKDIEYPSEITEDAIGFPSLWPWTMVKLTPQVASFERNPYYFKVDTAGNQLPYIDAVRDELVENLEMVTMKIVSGEVDHSYEYGTAAKFPFFKENEEKGDYRTILYDMARSAAIMMPNETYDDPVWREVLRDVRFRGALSLAINYEEIVENVFLGLAVPTRMTPNEYNPEKANQLLDEMGLDKRNDDGWRLGPDGKPFVIPVEFAPFWEGLLSVGELVAEAWQAVGIKTTLKQIAIGLYYERVAANEGQCVIHWNNALPDVWWMWAMKWGHHTFWATAPLWWTWNETGGKVGETPSPEGIRLFEATSDLMAATTAEQRESIKNEILKLEYDNVWFMDTVSDVKQPVMVSNNLGNVAHKGYALAANQAAEIYFFKK